MGLDVYIENYDKILFLGDFNSEPSETGWMIFAIFIAYITLYRKATQL